MRHVPAHVDGLGLSCIAFGDQQIKKNPLVLGTYPRQRG